MLKYLAPITKLCSANATWKKEAITVAGFADGTQSKSLAGLHFPFDLFIDDIGNMHIVDVYNHRILYWPVNSVEGHIVAGTGEPGSKANQLYEPSYFTSNDQYTVSDINIPKRRFDSEQHVVINLKTIYPFDVKLCR